MNSIDCYLVARKSYCLARTDFVLQVQLSAVLVVFGPVQMVCMLLIDNKGGNISAACVKLSLLVLSHQHLINSVDSRHNKIASSKSVHV